ncbi:MAG: GyrI-like domain-containing protein [Chitinophagaceae bacterium]|nr:GyrI-like domain-containing protein [Chitinophagaceae bacterium]
MEKKDLKKQYKQLYSCPAETPIVVDVPEMQFLMCDGKGAPDSPHFTRAIEALYSLSYTIKFACKKGPLQIDYGVMPLEGLWWADDMNDFSSGNKQNWKWTLMIMQPDFITEEMVDQATEQLKNKKKTENLEAVRLEKMQEGKCAQIMHMGPFSEEAETIAKLHAFIGSAGHKLSGKHREIYLSDMRRTAPEKLKTIIRQPFLP